MSVFNGREPDAQRADFDLGPLDSVSGRLTFMPASGVALQMSAGHLHGAEAEFAPQPRSSVNRFTASATSPPVDRGRYLGDNAGVRGQRRAGGDSRWRGRAW